MIEKFKLKHFDIVSSEGEKDFATLMVDILGYKNSTFGKAKFFVKNFLKVKNLISDIEKIDFENV